MLTRHTTHTKQTSQNEKPRAWHISQNKLKLAMQPPYGHLFPLICLNIPPYLGIPSSRISYLRGISRHRILLQLL